LVLQGKWDGPQPASASTKMAARVALALLLALPGSAAVRSLRASVVAASNHSGDKKVLCGDLPSPPHAKPKNYKDSKKTKYDTEKKKTVDVTFAAGAKIPFKCVPGYTTDGTKDGEDTFDVECGELGYYKTKGVCVKASKCGSLPTFPHAMPTGETKGDKVLFQCAPGYSLDGEEVVKGGELKNSVFEVECVAFKGKYEEFKGECKPYAFVASTETVRVYNQVFEALFTVTCSGTLKKAFGKDGKPPSGISAACDKIKDSAMKGKCSGLVTKIKGDFETQKKARETHDKKAKKDGKEWFDKKDPDRPNISKEAKAFCSDLWKLVEMPDKK